MEVTRAEGIVPLVNCVAFKEVRLAPERAGSVAPVNVSAEAVIVIFAEPLNETVLIVLAVCSVVAVKAFPVVL